MRLLIFSTVSLPSVTWSHLLYFTSLHSPPPPDAAATLALKFSTSFSLRIFTLAVLYILPQILAWLPPLRHSSLYQISLPQLHPASLLLPPHTQYITVLFYLLHSTYLSDLLKLCYFLVSMLVSLSPHIECKLINNGILSCLPLFLQNLAQCLAHSRSSNINY